MGTDIGRGALDSHTSSRALRRSMSGSVATVCRSSSVGSPSAPCSQA